MTDTVTPTYEQRYAVGVFFYDADAHLSGSDIEKLAQLIAKREHSLRVELDAARTRIAELEAKLEQK